MPRYNVNSPIKHGGRFIKSGVVSMDEEAALPLLKSGGLTPADDQGEPNGSQTATPPPSGGPAPAPTPAPAADQQQAPVAAPPQADANAPAGAAADPGGDNQQAKDNSGTTGDADKAQQSKPAAKASKPAAKPAAKASKAKD
ncbi:hypothetical protein [Marinobacter sp.]|uniref:hypothetical protein n=1 Tax=Marinobacter sp. TaxID=50741 RepID=UPI0034A2F284